MQATSQAVLDGISEKYKSETAQNKYKRVPSMPPSSSARSPKKDGYHCRGDVWPTRSFFVFMQQ
jgi:hypothetical protein